MGVAEKPHPLATAADLVALPEGERFHEVIAGVVVRKAVPSPAHGRAQRIVGGRVGDAYDRPSDPPPGGWWILAEVEVELEPHEVYRPDVLGFGRERLPALPDASPIAVRPDWVCEVLSRSNARTDLVRKMRGYDRAGVPHYWIVDPDHETLSVYRHTPDGYLMVAMAEPGEVVRVEPFPEVELDVGALFGHERA